MEKTVPKINHWAKSMVTSSHGLEQDLYEMMKNSTGKYFDAIMINVAFILE